MACKKGSLNNAGTKRNDVDKEMFLLQNVFDENKSWYLDDNLRANRINPALINKEDEDFMESNLMHAVNGRFYGNLEGLDLCIGDKVAWYLAAFGNTVDMHTGMEKLRFFIHVTFIRIVYRIFFKPVSSFLQKIDIQLGR